MNKQIESILLSVVPMEGEDGDLMPSLHTPKDIEQFAKLVAKECLALCTQHFAGAVGTYAGAHNSAVKKCADSIRERFGVE